MSQKGFIEPIGRLKNYFINSALVAAFAQGVTGGDHFSTLESLQAGEEQVSAIINENFNAIALYQSIDAARRHPDQTRAQYLSATQEENFWAPGKAKIVPEKTSDGAKNFLLLSLEEAGRQGMSFAAIDELSDIYDVKSDAINPKGMEKVLAQTEKFYASVRATIKEETAINREIQSHIGVIDRHSEMKKQLEKGEEFPYQADILAELSPIEEFKADNLLRKKLEVEQEVEKEKRIVTPSGIDFSVGANRSRTQFLLVRPDYPYWRGHEHYHDNRKNKWEVGLIYSPSSFDAQMKSYQEALDDLNQRLNREKAGGWFGRNKTRNKYMEDKIREVERHQRDFLSTKNELIAAQAEIDKEYQKLNDAVSGAAELINANEQGKKLAASHIEALHLPPLLEASNLDFQSLFNLAREINPPVIFGEEQKKAFKAGYLDKLGQYAQSRFTELTKFVASIPGGRSFFADAESARQHLDLTDLTVEPGLVSQVDVSKIVSDLEELTPSAVICD